MTSLLPIKLYKNKHGDVKEIWNLKTAEVKTPTKKYRLQITVRVETERKLVFWNKSVF